MGTRTVEVGELDVRTTLSSMALYPRDPTHRWLHNGFARAVVTPEGAGSIVIHWTSDGTVTADAYGPGGGWLLDRLPFWLGQHDDVSGFDPTPNERIAELWRRSGTFRLASVGVVWQELLLVIIGQRVAGNEAIKSWMQLCARWGEPAPGPDDLGLQLPPTPEVLRTLHYTDLHEIGIERRRADALLLSARRASRLEEAATMPVADAITRISALPGLGAWTATATVMASHGHPDVVLLRDYGMPTLVNYAFTGDSKRLPPEPDGDTIMLGHLEPWVGHRQRVVRLIAAAGISVPRRAPRAFNPDIRRF